MDQSDRSVRVDYISIFHPNNPPLVLGMFVGWLQVVAIEAGMDTS